MKKRNSSALVVTCVVVIMAVIFFMTNPIDLRPQTTPTTASLGNVSEQQQKVNQSRIDQTFGKTPEAGADGAPKGKSAPMSTVIIPNTSIAAQRPSETAISSVWWDKNSDAAAKTERGGS